MSTGSNNQGHARKPIVTMNAPVKTYVKTEAAPTTDPFTKKEEEPDFVINGDVMLMPDVDYELFSGGGNDHASFEETETKVLDDSKSKPELKKTKWL